MGSVLVCLCCGASETHFFPLGITESATLGFLLFDFRSLGFHIFSEGGGSCRRQGKSAAPRGAAWVSGWYDYVFLPAKCREQARGRGLWGTQFPAPGPRAAPLERYCKNGGSGVCGNDTLAVVWALFSGNGAGASVRASFWEVPARILPWVAKWVSRYLQIVLSSKYGQRSRFLCCGASEIHLFPLGITEYAKLGFRLLIFDPLVYILFRVRRQLPQAGESAAPSGRHGELVGVQICKCLLWR